MGEKVVLFRKKTEKKRKDAGKFGSHDIRIPTSPVELLATKAAENSKKVKEDLRHLKEDTQSFIAAKMLGKEIREKEIEQGELAAKEVEELRWINEVVEEFELEMEEESDAERLTKVEVIKKSVKKIREGKRKAKEVAKSKEKLLEKNKQVKEVAKAPTLKIRDSDIGEGTRTPTSPKQKRSEKGKEKMVEEPSKEAGKGRKKSSTTFIWR